MTHFIGGSALLVLIATCSLSVGCERQKPAASPALPPYHDAQVASAVSEQLELQRHLDARSVTVTVKHGVAMLRGQVNTSEESRRAAHAARLATGVRGVVNWLHVVEAGPADAELATRVRSALAPLSDLRLAARQGVVRVEGEASSLQQKRAIEAACWAVQGVIGVDNRLRVVPTPARSDAAIARDVRERLAADGYEDADALVAVSNGVVTLSGEVGSIFEEQRALERAAVSGAREVRDELSVLQERERFARQYAGIPSAAEIRAAILDAYRLDPRVPRSSLRVRVRAGVVTLSGAVSTPWQRHAAAHDAANAAGAWVVENHIRLPGELTADQLLERRLQKHVVLHPYVSGSEVNVEVERGHVTLLGQVLDTFQRDTAERVVRAAPGVRSIENRLTTDGQPQEQRSDSEIYQQIVAALREAPEVDASKVRVEVQDGVATIAGEVWNWESYDAVLEAVFDAMPRRVVNRLRRRPDPALLRSW